MDIRIRILFAFLLLYRIMRFFQNKEAHIDEQVEEIKEKVKILPSELGGLAFGITKMIALIAAGVDILLLMYSLQVLHYGLLSIIPITSFVILNCDITIFTCGTMEEFFRRGNHKYIKMLRYWYLVAAVAWFGLMTFLP